MPRPTPEQTASAAAKRLTRSVADELQLVASLGRIVAFGDSLTADAASWAEILSRALPTELINLGVSGDTTVHLVSRYEQVVAQSPQLVIVLAGTNDARRHGRAATRVLVPDAQTKINLRLIQALTREQTGARVVFVTPPPILERRVHRAPLLVRESVTWQEEDVDRKAALVAGLDATVVDSRAVMGPPVERFLLADGLHLSALGQERLARWILLSLAGLAAGSAATAGRARSRA